MTAATMTKAWVDLQLRLAKKADRLEDYERHLGMVDHPLPFHRWRMKDELLTRLFDRDPDGRLRSLDHQIHSLCNELGY